MININQEEPYDVVCMLLEKFLSVRSPIINHSHGSNCVNNFRIGNEVEIVANVLAAKSMNKIELKLLQGLVVAICSFIEIRRGDHVCDPRLRSYDFFLENERGNKEKRAI